MNKTKTYKNRPKLNIGDQILIPFGGGVSELKARVIEDRGNIGSGGRRIVRVETFSTGPVDVREQFEVAEEDVKVLRRKPQVKLSSRAKKTEYASKH